MSDRLRSELLRKLQAQIGRIEEGNRNPHRLECVSSGFPALDGLLPHQGFVGSALIEWLGAGEGHGAMTLALMAGGHIVRERGMLAVVNDPTFFPLAAAALGVPLGRTVVVRPRASAAALWALEQTLRCEGVMVTVARLGPVRGPVLRRLQLAAEAGGGLGFLVRPGECLAETPWAEARLLVSARPG